MILLHIILLTKTFLFQWLVCVTNNHHIKSKGWNNPFCSKHQEYRDVWQGHLELAKRNWSTTVTDVIGYYVNNILHPNNGNAYSEERPEMDTAPLFLNMVHGLPLELNLQVYYKQEGCICDDVLFDWRHATHFPRKWRATREMQTGYSHWAEISNHLFSPFPVWPSANVLPFGREHWIPKEA